MTGDVGDVLNAEEVARANRRAQDTLTTTGTSESLKEWRAQRCHLMCDYVLALAASHELLRRRHDETRAALAAFYAEVDMAQKIDNTGGDSAVSVALWGFAETLHHLSAAVSVEQSE